MIAENKRRLDFGVGFAHVRKLSNQAPELHLETKPATASCRVFAGRAGTGFAKRNRLMSGRYLRFIAQFVTN